MLIFCFEYSTWVSDFRGKFYNLYVVPIRSALTVWTYIFILGCLSFSKQGFLAVGSIVPLPFPAELRNWNVALLLQMSGRSGPFKALPEFKIEYVLEDIFEEPFIVSTRQNIGTILNTLHRQRDYISHHGIKICIYILVSTPFLPS